MTKEEIQEYSLRITQGNRSDLVVVTYDIILKYLNDARAEYQSGEKEQFVLFIKKANDFLAELMRALDLQYPMSRNLMSIYRFVQKIYCRHNFRRSHPVWKGWIGY